MYFIMVSLSIEFNYFLQKKELQYSTQNWRISITKKFPFDLHYIIELYVLEKIKK